MQSPGYLPENQSWLLSTLMEAAQNVPPGKECPFKIVESDSKYAISHPGLDGQTLVPDWLAFRALLRAGYVSQSDSSFELTPDGQSVASSVGMRTDSTPATAPIDVWSQIGDAPSSKPVNVFCAYSHEDERYLNDFRKHIAVLERSGVISSWTDKDILAGTDWDSEIDQHLLNSELVFLLISASFFSSDYCSSKELNAALARHRSGHARVIPIIVRQCDWKESPIGHLQAVPKNGHPISGWADQDDGWTDAVTRIRAVLRAFSKEATNTTSTVPSASTRDTDNTTAAPDLGNQSTDEDELGILDFEELIQEASSTIAEQMGIVTTMTLKLQENIEQWVASLPANKSNLPYPQKRKFAAQVAGMLSTYSEGVQDGAASIEENFETFGESFFSMHKMLDYSNPDEREQASQLISSARSFSAAIAPFVQQIESARSSMSAIPPLTKELRAAIKQSRLALASLANSARRGMDYADRIASTVEVRLDQAN